MKQNEKETTSQLHNATIGLIEAKTMIVTSKDIYPTPKVDNVKIKDFPHNSANSFPVIWIFQYLMKE